MMKNYFTFFLFFAFFCINAQVYGSCEEFKKKEKIELQNFKEDVLKNKEKLISLRNKIFDDLSKKILQENIAFSIQSESYGLIDRHIEKITCSNHYFTSYKPDLEIYKNNFIDSLFWKKETFIYAKKILRKNIYPVYGINRNAYITEENLSQTYKNDKFSFISSFQKIYNPIIKDKIFYLPQNKKAEKKNMIGNFTSIRINFNNYTSGIVLIQRINNNEAVLFKKNMAYQYINKQWKFTETH